MKFLLIKFIKIYQIFFSPILAQIFGIRCRYFLSCSEYANQAIEKNGAIKGSLKSLRRIASCQPFSKGYKYV